jgi:hypothetical protein
MELLLKREEKPGTFGTRYDLFAKLELKPEELAHVRKTKPDKVLILKDDPGKSANPLALMSHSRGTSRLFCCSVAS